MQHKLSFQCIDSTLLKLNEHLDSANLASDCCAPPDDVEIISGLASFDDGDNLHHGQSNWIDSNHSHGVLEDLEDLDDALAAFDYNPTPAHSAPVKPWHFDGFEKLDSSAVPQYKGSSLVRDSEPWSPLRTFAISAPEHNDQSSRHFQIDAISQWPSSLPGNDLLRSPMISLHHLHQAPAKHQRMSEDQQSAEESMTQHPRHHHPAWNPRNLNLQNSRTFEQRGLYGGGQQMMDGSTSSNFSQPATNDLLMNTDPAHFFDPQSTYPLHDSSYNQLRRSGARLRQDPEIDFAIDQGLIDESRHSSMPAGQDVLTPQDLSWRQPDHDLFKHQLSTSTDTDYGSYGLSFPTDDRTWSPEFVQDPSLDFTNLDHPGAIKIGGSSGHYKPQLPSSFPPSADCFPEYISAIEVPGRYEAVISTSESSLHPSSPPNIPFQKKFNKPTFTRASRSGSLSIIREYGHSQHGSPTLSRSGSNKGKRKGPLPTATALAAAQKRKDGNVCIRCRTMKMTCKGGLPCEGCRQITKVKLWDQTCTPANFTDMVKEGTCNAVFQYAINHLVLDESRRLLVTVPTVLNVSRLLDRLESSQSRYNIRVRNSSRSCYTLNLSNCFRTLTKIYKACGFETCELQDLVKNKQLRSAWLQCVEEYDPAASVVDRSIQWNNMPSRNSYDLAPLNRSALDRALDVEDQQDRGTIIFATQLSRIILRAFEIEAFEALQKSVNELTKGGKSDTDIQILISQLGRVLMSLRWRVSWWAIAGDSPDERSVSRVTKLAQIIYCYYFVAKKKMSPSSGQLGGRVRSDYADVESFYEDLPLTDSVDGFHAWMENGKTIVQAMRVQAISARSMPTASISPHS